MPTAYPWVYFLLVAVVFRLLRMPLFHFVDALPVHRARYVALDGLRGLAALSVFAFHIVVTHRFILTGVWEAPPPGLFAVIGPLGVSVFFMITGFLFWTKLLSAKGAIGWRGLYIGRLFRIAPMYLFVVSVMLIIVFARTGLALREPASRVAAAILQWLALGVVNTQPVVNGYAATHVLAGVTWTISYEWGFYASLPLLAVLASWRAPVAYASGALLLCLAGRFHWHSDILGFAALFCAGMTVASLVHAGTAPVLSDRTSSAIAVACVAVIITAASFGQGISGYGTPALMLLVVFFYMVCSGATLYGLLTSLGAQRLGSISYSIYLLQGIVLTLVFSVPFVRNFAMTVPANFWLTGLVSACLLVLAASFTYTVIERPAIRLGQRLARGSRLVRSSSGVVVEPARVEPLPTSHRLQDRRA